MNLGKPQHIVHDNFKDFQRRKRREQDAMLRFIWYLILAAMIIASITIKNPTLVITTLVLLAITFLPKFIKKNSRSSKKSHRSGFVKKYFVWFLAFTVGLWISIFLLGFISISNMIVRALFIGLIIEIASKIMQVFVYRAKFIVDKHFVFWVIIQSVSFYIASFIYEKIQIPSYFPYSEIVFMGLIITIFVNLIWRSGVERKVFS
jgi:hypothetical protein